MTMPLDPGMMPEESPVSFEMLMSLRNAARGKMSLQGAAERRLGEEQPDQTIVDGMTPDEIALEDMQESMDAAIEPPDITQTAATTMMRYGAIQDYLMRAKGEIPGG